MRYKPQLNKKAPIVNINVPEMLLCSAGRQRYRRMSPFKNEEMPTVRVSELITDDVDDMPSLVSKVKDASFD